MTDQPTEESNRSRSTILDRRCKPHQKISWQITGIRQDTWANDNRIPVEEAKPKAERGTYLYPQGFGKPESAGLNAKVRGLAS